MSKKDGGPAFPSVGEGYGNPLYSAPGMTLRDWFAGQIIVGMFAESAIRNTDETPLVRAAYRYADAMLAERERSK